MTDIVFVDTNVAMDLLLERKPFFEISAKLFSASESNKIDIFFSSLGFSTLEYILSRQNGKIKSKIILKKFKQLVKILAVDEYIIEQALNSDFSDFEDAIQYEVAKKNNLEVIITRNVKDYRKSEIPVFLPEDYLKLLMDFDDGS